MPEKKSYSAPRLVRVELNHEQAILSVCSTAATTLQAGTTNRCRRGGCKKAGSTSGTSDDSAGRRS
jgi:hypothetical protein